MPASIADRAAGIRHVFIRDMVLPASIGIHPHEHAATQRVRINVDLGVDDTEEAIGRDELPRVVDYEKVANAVRAIGSSPIWRARSSDAASLSGSDKNA